MKSPPASKKPAPSTSSAVETDDVAVLPGELRQLAEVRTKFAQLAPELALAMLRTHDNDTCRERGGSTRANAVFRGAMAWARVYSANVGAPGVSAVRVRWFLDCLTSLGMLLMGRATASNPADESGYDDAALKADKLLARTVRRAEDAAGTHGTWRDALSGALKVDDVRDVRVTKLTRLAAQLARWLASADGPPLAAYDLTAATVTALSDAAAALDEAIAHKPPPGQVGRDSPAVNIAEGRVLYAMRPLWDDLAEAREDGLTDLQLPVTPTLTRGLDLKKRTKKPTT